jgi:hypothetical protein
MILCAIATCGAGSAILSGAQEFIPVFCVALPLSFEKRLERISGHITHVINIDLSYRFRDNIAIADDRQREATG